ncbi:mCpol domain-containing protein [Vibrio alginolyticus]|uniref:mCpol domain-containing protein n=1 Tax=Vibrio diabolicus TaxID=50719 RepID=UPI00211B2501|nr:mCpol domain-containing protein [Vibrio diabolicus]ELB2789119.1 mCpol domain-containing protein [Vibrio alginolyticus]MCG9618927.1 mCpol domain-containing protein [Vibrio diabolicus]
MIYITIDGDDIGQMITSSYLKNDIDELSRINHLVNNKTTLIADFLKKQGFSIIFCAADGVAGYIESDEINEMLIFQSIKDIANPELTFSAGLGSTLQESYIALISAKSNGKRCLHKFSDLN